jgi:hypothetical protein
MPSPKAGKARRILVVKGGAGALEGSALDHLCNGLLTRAAFAPPSAAVSADLVWIEVLHSGIDAAFVWKGTDALPWDRVKSVAGADAEAFADDSVGDKDFDSGRKAFQNLARWVWT